MRKADRNRLLRDMVRAIHDPAAAPDLSDPEVTTALEYWAAKGCVELDRAWGGDIVGVRVTPNGISYFDDQADAKREKRTDAVRGFFTNYFAGLFSGITATLLLEHVILPLLSKVLK